MEGRKGEQPGGHVQEGTEQLPEEGEADEAVGDERLARGTSAKASAPRARKRSAGGSVFAPAPSISGSETSAPWAAAPAQASRPAASATAAAPGRGQQQAPGEPAAAADREREHRLQPLLGLLFADRGDLHRAEQAHGEDEEDEREAEPARRRDDRPGPELLELALHVLGDHVRRRGVGEHAHQERERADPHQPGDEGAALGPSACAAGEPSRRSRGGALSRAGSRPLPMSRRT